MTTESEPETPEEPRPSRFVVAVEDEEVRRRFSELLGDSVEGLELVDAGSDPLEESLPTADLLVVRRDEVRARDLRLMDAYTRDENNPGLMVMSEDAGDVDRTRLLSAGALGVVDGESRDEELGEAVAALAQADRRTLRDPLAGREDSEPRLADFQSRSPLMRRFLDLVQQVVNTDSSLLVTGETGVGKERLAQAIHNEGPRSAGPFVSVNCGALPEALLESELFGHEEGAFTGAQRRKRGRFQQADGGTIFLDEIGEMPKHLQVRLLSVLQRRQVRRVGADEPEAVDVRVIAATHRDLREEVRQGRFRQDLYFRLNVVNLEIPALRERPEDVPDLVGAFLRHFRGGLGQDQVQSIDDAALDYLVHHPWPGNVRQLMNAVEHAMVVSHNDRIELEDLPVSLQEPELLEAPPEGGVEGASADAGARALPRRRAPAPRPGPGGDPAGDLAALHAEVLGLPLAEARRRLTRGFERAYLERLLQEHGGRVGRVAEAAGITPRSLYDKMKAHGLKKEAYR